MGRNVIPVKTADVVIAVEEFGTLETPRAQAGKTINGLRPEVGEACST
jgi:hypothetical protein